VKGHQDSIHFYFASKDSYDTSERITLKYTVCGLEILSLNDPVRAIFLYSRDGSKAFDPRMDYLPWYNVDYSAMDHTTYPMSNECKIDDYTVVEDSYNVPKLVSIDKQCVDYWKYGK
jgi:hypothetical protein